MSTGAELPEPRDLGTIVIGNARLPVVEMKLAGGYIEVTAEGLNPFPEGPKGAGWPRTYDLLGLDDQLIRRGLIPPAIVSTTAAGHRWRFTARIEVINNADT